MTVTIKYGAYNQRRYSRPWIAKVTGWTVGKSPVLEFGYYNGDDLGGFCEIEADAGDIVKSGQKDYRALNKSTNDFFLVNDDGDVSQVTPAEARQAWTNKHN